MNVAARICITLLIRVRPLVRGHLRKYRFAFMDFLSELRSRLRTALASLTDSPDSYVEMLKPSQDGKFGDFQANCAMPLAKHPKKARDVAAELIEKLDVADLCEVPDIAGPGFINFRLKTARLAAETAKPQEGEAAANWAYWLGPLLQDFLPNLATG